MRLRAWTVVAVALGCVITSAASAAGSSQHAFRATRAVGDAQRSLHLDAEGATEGLRARLVGGLARAGARQALPCGFRNDKTITIDSQVMHLQVVSTTASRELGLSGRACIETDEAMLFVFPDAGSYGFWMKEMNFPLDMVWLSPSGKVVKIERDLQPSTYPQVFANTTPAQFVLEMAAGRATSLGLKVGSSVDL